jgi:hypothetical protein
VRQQEKGQIEHGGALRAGQSFQKLRFLIFPVKLKVPTAPHEKEEGKQSKHHKGYFKRRNCELIESEGEPKIIVGFKGIKVYHARDVYDVVEKEGDHKEG